MPFPGTGRDGEAATGVVVVVADRWLVMLPVSGPETTGSGVVGAGPEATRAAPAAAITAAGGVTTVSDCSSGRSATELAVPTDASYSPTDA